MHDNSQTILFANDFIHQISLWTEIEQLEERQHFSTASTKWDIPSFGWIKKIPRVSSRLVLPEFYPHFFLSHFLNLTYNPLFHAVTMMLGNLSLSKIHNFPTNFALLCSSSWQCLSHAVYSTRTLSWHTWKKSTWESKVLNQTPQKHWKGLVFFSLWGPHP